MSKLFPRRAEPLRMNEHSESMFAIMPQHPFKPWQARSDKAFVASHHNRGPEVLQVEVMQDVEKQQKQNRIRIAHNRRGELHNYRTFSKKPSHNLRTNVTYHPDFQSFKVIPERGPTNLWNFTGSETQIAGAWNDSHYAPQGRLSTDKDAYAIALGPWKMEEKRKYLDKCWKCDK
jgi:hypothetical protein